MNTTTERSQVSAEPVAEVIADGNGLRLLRALPAGAKLYADTPPASEALAVEIDYAIRHGWPSESLQRIERMRTARALPEPDDTPLETGETDAR